LTLPVTKTKLSRLNGLTRGERGIEP